mgnify:CR=1 FL=1
MSELRSDVYTHIGPASAGARKWVSATAVADFGDAQAMAVSPSRRSAIWHAVGSALLTNRSGSAATMGLGVRYLNANWFAGQVTAAGALTDDTTDAQDEGTADFPMHDRTDSGSGFLVSCTDRFNILGIIQSTAGDQVAPVRLVEYWNGTAWTDIEATLLIADGLNPGAVNERVLCWPMPLDWVVGGTGTGVSATRFNLRVRFTTGGAGTVNPQCSQMFVGFAVVLNELVGDAGQVNLAREHELRFPRSGRALHPVFSVASRNNLVEVDHRFYI